MVAYGVLPWLVFTHALSDATGAAWNEPLPVALFVTEPASRSAWLTGYVAVQVMNAPGARLAVAGQIGRAAWRATTVIGPDSVTLKVVVSLKREWRRWQTGE